MKVQNVETNRVIAPFAHGLEVVEPESSDVVFRARLDDAVQQDGAEYVQGKMQEITEMGDRLGEKADIGMLNKYKSLIKELMDYTVSNGFKFTKSSSFDSRGRGKVFGIVKKVNEKLNQLTKDILEEEKDNIDVVASINDIRGLLVDMFL